MADWKLREHSEGMSRERDVYALVAAKHKFAEKASIRSGSLCVMVSGVGQSVDGQVHSDMIFSVAWKRRLAGCSEEGNVQPMCPE